MSGVSAVGREWGAHRSFTLKGGSAAAIVVAGLGVCALLSAVENLVPSAAVRIPSAGWCVRRCGRARAPASLTKSSTVLRGCLACGCPWDACQR